MTVSMSNLSNHRQPRPAGPRLNLGFQVELVADSLVPVLAHLACIPCREPQDPFFSDLVVRTREHPLMKKGYTTITHTAPM